MPLKLYGKIELQDDTWKILDAEPHVCIRLKNIFPKISKTRTLPFCFKNTPENCSDLYWFLQRYPMEITKKDSLSMNEGRETFFATQIEMERILLPEFKPGIYKLRDGEKIRHYQAQVIEVFKRTKSLLIGDDVGLGKTYEAIGAVIDSELLPAVIVVRPHLQQQWKEKIESFSYLKAHKIKGTRPYDLPASDVYILKYSCLAGWVDIFQTGFFKTVVFDEMQELRVYGSQKYHAAVQLANYTEYKLGLTASPVYNYGDEIFNILDILKKDCLGNKHDFLREWAGDPYGGRHNVIHDPKALGTYLRENHLFIRRTREEVGQYLPPVNKIVHTVDYDEKAVKSIEDLARTLAIKITSGSFLERGKAARELDIMVRKNTGVSKAKFVAEYTKIILENGEPVLLAGWHRDVYEIWLEELKSYNPAMYTGSESPSQKQKAKDAFVNGDTDLMIISLRSGVGLDGLQHRGSIVIIGELDWSPKVHDQLIGRLNREGQAGQVTAIYLVSDSGSDPLIIDLLGLKSSQSKGIIDPFATVEQQFSDEKRMRLLAERYLKNIKALKKSA